MKKRLLACLLAACILGATLPSASAQESGGTAADGDTRDHYTTVLGEPSSTQYTGRVWADHTVSAADTLTFTESPDVRVAKNAGEDFLVAYSTLSGTQDVTLTMQQRASDTVFVLDFSMTMNQNMKGGSPAVSANPLPGDVTPDTLRGTRIYAMLNAMEETIFTLKTSNGTNRAGIVTFYGAAHVLLPLTDLSDIPDQVPDAPDEGDIVQVGSTQRAVNYTTPRGYFSIVGYKKHDAANNKSWVQCNIGGSSTNELGDWTSMQSGLYEALAMFRERWSGEASPEALKDRQANLIVITDGASNAVARPVEDKPWYEAMETGRYSTIGDNSGAVAFATILTAAYSKHEIAQRYDGCSIYTVGLSSDDFMRLLLDPATYTQDKPDDSAWTAFQTLWEKYQAQKPDGSDAPHVSDVAFTAPRDAADGSVVPAKDSWEYADDFYDIATAVDLADAFKAIARQITLARPQPPSDVEGDPWLSGYITYTAPLGEYMEIKDVKGILFQNKWFDVKKTVTETPDISTYIFEGTVQNPAYGGGQELADIRITATRTNATHQRLTIHIPASVIPLRNNIVRLFNTPDNVQSHTTQNCAPMRIVYAVGLMDTVNRETLEGVSDAYKEEHTDADGNVLFYCNAFDGQKAPDGKTVGNVTAAFTAGQTNPFYYAPAGTALYTDDQGTPATTFSTGTAYYVRQDYYYKDAGGDSHHGATWLSRSDLTEEDVTVNTETLQLALKRSVLKQVNLGSARTLKAPDGNASKTAAYAYYAQEQESTPGAFLAYLGNNGRLALLPEGQVTISKTVQAAQGSTLPAGAATTDFALALTAAQSNGDPLCGTFDCEVYGAQGAWERTQTVTLDSAGKAQLAIRGGQVLRLIVPQGVIVTVQETPPAHYTVVLNISSAVAKPPSSNFTADVENADIQITNIYDATPQPDTTPTPAVSPGPAPGESSSPSSNASPAAAAPAAVSGVIPQTGDEMPVALLGGSAAAAAAALAVLLVVRKRRHGRD